MKLDSIIAAAEYDERSDRGSRFAPDAGCPRWLPLLLLAGAAVYPALAWLILTSIF